MDSHSHTAELLRLATLPQNTRENWSKATVVQFTDAVARLLSDRNATQHNSELVGLLDAAEICDKMAADEFKTQQYDRTDKAMYACHKRIMERFSALKKAAPQVPISSHNENGPASHTTPLSPPCVVLPIETVCLISSAAMHLRTWATSKNKDPYANTLDLANRLDAFIAGVSASVPAQVPAERATGGGDAG